MFNSEVKKNKLDGSGFVFTLHKQPLNSTKKAVLADVKNDNSSLVGNHQGSSLYVTGKPVLNTVKVGGNKRHTPDSFSCYPFPPPSRNTVAKDYCLYPWKKFEGEPEKRRIQNTTNSYVNSPEMKNFCNMLPEIPRKQTQLRTRNEHCVPVVAPIQKTPPSMTFSNASPSLPTFLGKLCNGVQAAERDSLKAFSEVPNFTNSKSANGKIWEERFILLLTFLKSCDESNNTDLVQRLRQLPVNELNNYACELETKAIQLTIEEGIEMQRMEALNILGKSSGTMNPPRGGVNYPVRKTELKG